MTDGALVMAGNNWDFITLKGRGILGLIGIHCVIHC